MAFFSKWLYCSNALAFFYDSDGMVVIFPVWNMYFSKLVWPLFSVEYILNSGRILTKEGVMW